jgi:hypothetical protein
MAKVRNSSSNLKKKADSKTATAQHKALTGMLAAHGGHPGTSHSAGDYRQMVGSGTRGAKR